MSDFGLFESDEAAGLEPRVAARTAARRLDAAIEEVRAKFGPFLLGATGIDEFGDRWHLSKHDIRKTVEPYVHPATGTMRRVMNAMKADWKLAHPYKLAEGIGGEGGQTLPSGVGGAGGPVGPTRMDSTGIDGLGGVGGPTTDTSIVGPGIGSGAMSGGYESFNGDSTAPAYSGGDASGEYLGVPGQPGFKGAGRRQALSHDEAGFGSMPEGDHDHRNQNLKKTYHPSDGNLIPKGDFEGWKDSVDQDGPEKVEAHDFTPGGDSGSAKNARRLEADSPYGGVRSERFMPGFGHEEPWWEYSNEPHDHDHPYDRGLEYGKHGPLHDDHQPMRIPPADYEGKHRASREAAALVADIYTDFARSNGLRVASLDTLAAYAETGIHEADYRLLESMIIRTAEADCEDDDEDSDDEDSDTDSAPPSPSESDDSDDSDTEDDEEGDDAPEPSESDSDEESDSEGEEAPDFGGDDTGGDVGQTFTVPSEAPELDPQMQAEIPADDTDGSAPVPPEVVDSLLGLPPGTIEQLLLEEVQGGGSPAPGPEAGGDDFLGGAGGDNIQPPRMARRRVAAPDESEEELTERQKRQQRESIDTQHKNWTKSKTASQKECDICKHVYGHKVGAPAVVDGKSKMGPWAFMCEDHFFSHGLGLGPGVGQRISARSFWAAEGDEQQAGGGDSGGGQQAAPAQDPAAAGMDPSMMGGGQPMMPPPGSQSIQPPAPAAPLENQPAEDQLLDMASQAITQMIDRETQEFQQIIDPLTQALQAVQFAQQVESAEHPLDVTPQQGTVNVDPSQAPAAQANPMQPTASRRHAGESDAEWERFMDDMRDASGIQTDDSGPLPVHTFPSTGAAYNGSQTNDVIDDNHLFHIPSEGVVGYMHSAWPVAVTQAHGELHHLTPAGAASNEFAAGRAAAQELARQHGYPLHDPFADEPVRQASRRNAAHDYAGNDDCSCSGSSRHARREAKKVDILKKAAYVIARRHGLSEDGYRDIVAATLGRRDYEHILEAVRLAHPAEREDVGGHLAHLFAAGNPRFNKDVWMKAVMASKPRDRAWDAWASGRDRGDAEHKRQDLEDRDDDGDEGRTASRGRHPFDRPRLAGETWVHKSINDTFEFDNDQPQSRDNMTINDLPKVPGGHVGSSQRAIDRFQRWENYRQQRGLPAMSDDAEIHNFQQTSKPYKSKVGDDAEAKIHRDRNLEPDAPKTPKVKVPKAVNPVLKGKGTKTPAAPKPKVPKTKAAARQASFFTRKVPGWRWDDHLSGYISKEGRAFTCSCGQKVAAPSYKSCDCGKIWNVYAIGDTHHLASDSAEMFIAREIPVRDNVIMANRKMAAPDRWFEHEQQDLHRQRRQEEDDADAWAEKRMNTPYPDDGAYREASRSHAELLAMIDKLADWTKYDDPEDPVAKAYGKSKIPSTKAPKIPRDWSKREPDGKWKNTNFAPKKK